jgi:hypothetical protein
VTRARCGKRANCWLRCMGGTEGFDTRDLKESEGAAGGVGCLTASISKVGDVHE